NSVNGRLVLSLAVRHALAGIGRHDDDADHVTGRDRRRRHDAGLEISRLGDLGYHGLSAGLADDAHWTIAPFTQRSTPGIAFTGGVPSVVHRTMTSRDPVGRAVLAPWAKMTAPERRVSLPMTSAFASMTLPSEFSPAMPPGTPTRLAISATWLSADSAVSTADAALSSIASSDSRSEEHTSELQSRFDLVCRLLLEKKN